MKARAIPLTKAGELSAKDVMLTVLQRPKNAQVGATIEEMVQVLPVVTAIKAVEVGMVHLTDVQWQDLVDRFNNFPFAVIAPELVTIRDSIKNAKEVELEEKTDA